MMEMPGMYEYFISFSADVFVFVHNLGDYFAHV